METWKVISRRKTIGWKSGRFSQELNHSFVSCPAEWDCQLKLGLCCIHTVTGLLRGRGSCVWPWPCSGTGHQGEGRADPPRPGATISGPWGKIPKQWGAGGRWGPAWIRTGVALSCHEDERNKKEQRIQPMRAFIKNPNQLILSTRADPEEACLPGPHLALSLAHVPVLLFN